MDPIVKKFANIFIAPMLVFGLYVVIYGHVLPGEGFDGGILIAGAFILTMMVYGREEARKRLNFSFALIVSALAGLCFIIIGLLGLAGFSPEHKFIFDNFLPQGNPSNLFSGGIVPVCNVVLGIMVGTGFYALFGYLVVSKGEKGENEK